MSLTLLVLKNDYLIWTLFFKTDGCFICNFSILSDFFFLKSALPELFCTHGEKQTIHIVKIKLTMLDKSPALHTLKQKVGEIFPQIRLDHLKNLELEAWHRIKSGSRLINRPEGERLLFIC